MTAGTDGSFGALKQVDAGLLSVGYAEAGPDDAPAVILLHGWPYDIHSYADVTGLLASAGYRVIVPITLEGDANGAPHPEPGAYAAKFSGRYAHRTVSGGVGHNVPQEAPQAFAQAIIDVAGQR